MTDLNADGTGQGNTGTGDAGQASLTNANITGDGAQTLATSTKVVEVNPFDALKGSLPDNLKIKHTDFEELVKEYSTLKDNKSVIPEEYEFEMPEDYKQYVDDEALNKFSEFAKGSGITQEQANALLAFDAQRFEAMATQQDKVIETNENALKTEWGDKYPENIQTANKAFKVYADSMGKKDTDFSDEFRKTSDIHRMFHFFGSKMSEAAFVAGNATDTKPQTDSLGDTFLFDPNKIKE